MDDKLLITVVESIPLGLAIIFVIYFLFNKNENKVSRIYLILFFIALILIQFFLISADHTDNDYGKLLIPLIVGGALIIAPTMYAYVNSLIFKQKNLNPYKLYFIGILFFVINLLVFSIIIFTKGDDSIRDFIGDLLYFTTIFPLAVIFPIQSIYYIYLSFRSIKKHQIDIGEIYSYREGINLQWVKIFLAGFIIWFILVFFNSYIASYQTEKLSFLAEYFYEITTTVFILFIGIKAIQQTTTNNVLAISLAKTELKIDASSESDNSDKFILIKDNLDKYTKEEKPYLDSSITIYDLAKMISTNYKYLSKTINKEYGQNFVSYINHFRIIEAKELLQKPENNNYTIEAIGEMSGFKSKSAFNLAFKKNTGYTPSEYKNKI